MRCTASSDSGRHADAVDGRRCCQIAEDQTEGMIGPDLVVTVGDDEEGAQPADPPAEEPQQLERGAVGPMGVLADHERRARPRGQGRKYLPEERFAGIAVKSVWLDLEPERGSKVTDGAERTRCGERIARRAQRGRRTGDPPAELVDQRGLADTGLAADEDHPPVPGRGQPEVLLELGQGGSRSSSCIAGLRGAGLMIRRAQRAASRSTATEAPLKWSWRR